MPNQDQVLLETLESARRETKAYDVETVRALALNNGADLSHLPWYPQELSILGALHTPQTAQGLAAATGLDLPRVARILHVLDSLKLIRLGEGQPAKPEPFKIERFVPEIRRSGLGEKLEAIHREGSFISEQFKTLKIKIGDIKLITVSSAQTEDGKTLIAANLAASFAKDPGRRVLIVDCDLRNPSLHQLFGISADPGVLGYLGNPCLQPYCYMRRFENLYLMTAGGIAPNPVELLTQSRMKQLMESLRSDFDTVIIDSPPFVPISDASILTSLADGLLLVVRCGRTSFRNIEKAYAALDRSKLLGLVLNDVKPMMFNTQYDYKYYNYKYKDHYPYKGPKPAPKQKTYLDP